MWEGVVVSIHVAPVARTPLVAVDEALAVAGQGARGRPVLRASRYGFETTGTGRAVTLIEAEALEALSGEAGY